MTYTKHSLRYIPVSTNDTLSQKYIQSNLKELSDAFQDLRDSLDFHINHMYGLQSGKPLMLLKNLPPPTYSFAELQPCIENHVFKGQSLRSDYPIGSCYKITAAAYGFIKGNPSLPAFLPLQQFIRHGGVFKIIWGGIRQDLFQTAFQVGSYYFDISNDTLDVRKSKLEIKRFADSHFHNIDSFIEFAKIKELYHDVDIYRNHCLPELFPYYPLFFVRRKDCRLKLLNDRYMAIHSISHHFEPVLELSNIPELPDYFVKQIMHIKGRSSEDKEYLHFHLFSGEEMDQKIKALKLISMEEKLADEKLAHKHARFLNNLIKYTQKKSKT